MAKLDTLWTTIGRTTHVGQTSGKVVEKVRYGVDLVKRIKSAGSSSYIKSKGERLNATRIEFINLPRPMLKMEALQYALTAPEFQSPLDQALIQEQIENREPKKPRAKRIKADIDSIQGRNRKATVEDVLNAIKG
jgi:hypothetical protein